MDWPAQNEVGQEDYVPHAVLPPLSRRPDVREAQQDEKGQKGVGIRPVKELLKLETRRDRQKRQQWKDFKNIAGPLRDDIRVEVSPLNYAQTLVASLDTGRSQRKSLLQDLRKSLQSRTPQFFPRQRTTLTSMDKLADVRSYKLFQEILSDSAAPRYRDSLIKSFEELVKDLISELNADDSDDPFLPSISLSIAREIDLFSLCLGVLSDLQSRKAPATSYKITHVYVEGSTRLSTPEQKSVDVHWTIDSGSKTKSVIAFMGAEFRTGGLSRLGQRSALGDPQTASNILQRASHVFAFLRFKPNPPVVLAPSNVPGTVPVEPPAPSRKPKLVRVGDGPRVPVAYMSSNRDDGLALFAISSDSESPETYECEIAKPVEENMTAYAFQIQNNLTIGTSCHTLPLGLMY